MFQERQGGSKAAFSDPDGPCISDEIDRGRRIVN